MKMSKAQNRDKKHFKKVNGMRVSGKSLFVIQETQYNKAQQNKKNKKSK